MRVILLFISILIVGSGAMAKEAEKSEAEMVAGLRQMVLSLKPGDLGISEATFPHEVWGVLMETGYDSGAFTLVVLADGTVSLYFSTGGGVIGAGEHESVRQPAGSFIDWANRYVSEAKPSKAQPLPTEGQTTFYFLTNSGIRSYSAKEVELGEGRDKLSDLFHAGHAVIAEVRKTQQ